MISLWCQKGHRYLFKVSNSPTSQVSVLCLFVHLIILHTKPCCCFCQVSFPFLFFFLLSFNRFKIIVFFFIIWQKLVSGSSCVAGDWRCWRDEEARQHMSPYLSASVMVMTEAHRDTQTHTQSKTNRHFITPLLMTVCFCSGCFTKKTRADSWLMLPPTVLSMLLPVDP